MANVGSLLILSCILALCNSLIALNIIDSCWRTQNNWSTNRQSLANCATGFGHGALGGQRGAIYVVTDPSDDPIDPKPGTLRYGVTRIEPLWIIFQRDMILTLKNELLVNSYKTIDGRGVKVEMAYGPCIKLQNVQHVIIHGINIHDCGKGNLGLVLSSPNHILHQTRVEGDAITVKASSNIWIDHCHLASCYDGLIDVALASTNITVSNNYFTNHEKVMLLGNQDGNIADRIMQVTVTFNHFGPRLGKRMPRVRYGYAHVANNYYEPWGEYAIGGSSNPTILSEGNYFIASDNPEHKQVTKREPKNKRKHVWKYWRWTSTRDLFRNGAYFVASGLPTGPPPYSQSQVFPVADGSQVPTLIEAGPLQCIYGEKC